MSATYDVKGFVDIRVNINKTYNCSGGASMEDVAEIVRSTLTDEIGNCDVITHNLIMERIS